jgi:hypothetical protein
MLQQLDQCKGVPDFNSYLVFIFAKAESVPIEVRPHPPPSCARRGRVR